MALAVKAAGSVKRAIRAAISHGAPQYNEGDVEGCASTYAQTAEDVVRRCTDAPTVKALREVLRETAGTSDADKVAWALRRVFDKLLSRSVDPQLSVAVS